MKKFENITVDIATVWGIKRMCAALREGGHKTPKYNYFDNNIFVMLESL